MKKILSLVLAIVFMFALAIPAFAETISDFAQTGGGTVTATYTVTGHYTITIPADFTLAKQTETSATASQTVTVQNVLIPSGKTLTVTLSAASFAEGKFYLVNSTNSKIPYTISNTEDIKEATNITTNNATIITVAAGSLETDGYNAVLAFDADISKAIYMGAHTDTLTFTSSVN